ncbi:MAG: hypothetical protein IT537_30160 [Hyphomicrobiales bacterium]|nr:hypothetical protein [Hyphomicrobiales bacterium]
MANNQLPEIQLAAALAEEVYRRNLKDIPIKLADLGVTPRDFDQLTGFQRVDGSDSGGGVYYYTNRGFVGEVVVKAGIFYVVFRGTDSSEGFIAGAAKALAPCRLGRDAAPVRSAPSPRSCGRRAGRGSG